MEKTYMRVRVKRRGSGIAWYNSYIDKEFLVDALPRDGYFGSGPHYQVKGSTRGIAVRDCEIINIKVEERMKNQMVAQTAEVLFDITRDRWWYKALEGGHLSQIDLDPSWENEDGIWIVRNKTMGTRIIAVQDMSIDGHPLSVVKVIQEWGEFEVGQLLVVRFPKTQGSPNGGPVYVLPDGRSSIPASHCEEAPDG